MVGWTILVGLGNNDELLGFCAGLVKEGGVIWFEIGFGLMPGNNDGDFWGVDIPGLGLEGNIVEAIVGLAEGNKLEVVEGMLIDGNRPPVVCWAGAGVGVGNKLPPETGGVLLDGNNDDEGNIPPDWVAPVGFVIVIDVVILGFHEELASDVLPGNRDDFGWVEGNAGGCFVWLRKEPAWWVPPASGCPKEDVAVLVKRDVGGFAKSPVEASLVIASFLKNVVILVSVYEISQIISNIKVFLKLRS